MKTELAFALITPYSLAKSRTGGIIGRLISQAQLDFVGARMYMPSDAFVDEYLDIIEDADIKQPYKALFSTYIDDNLRPERAKAKGMTNRCMLLLFKGVDACRHLRDVIGSPTPRPQGDTIRGTYGDCVARGNDILYFEPAVLTASDAATNRRTLAMLAKYAEIDGGALDDRMPKTTRAKSETTLVMLKPDNFFKRSSRPGNIIDMFSKTGLTIVGAKLFRMSVEQGVKFYGFLEDIFVAKLGFLVANKLKEKLGGAFDYAVEDEEYAAMSEVLKKKNAHREFCKIVEFMTGRNPDVFPSPKSRREPGTAMCLALIYTGENAIEKIRAKLGPTDPKKAEGGTVRSDYGNDLMKNGAHASDSVASAKRERPIIGLAGGEASDEKKLILDWLKNKG